MPLDLLLTRADDHRPVLQRPLPSDAAAQPSVPRQTPTDGYMRDDMENPQDLALQRWGIVAPEGATGDALIEAVQILIRARQEKQGGKVITYRVSPGMDAERVAEWKRDVYWDSRVSRQERPRYLLILGDLDEISLEFQQIVGADVYVGRIAFRSTNDYAAYAQKVLRWENQPSMASQARALFFAVMDRTSATATGRSALIEPLLDSCRESQASGYFRASEIIDVPYGRDSRDPGAALLAAVSNETPALLFSVSHGLGPPRGGFPSFDHRRALQGAMDLGNGRRLAGEDWTKQTFLPGGIWFNLSCYGGATPRVSAYHRWLKVLRENSAYRESADAVLEGLPRPDENPFVAALPQALLANPHGPLAIVSHADLAWSCAFEDSDSKKNRAERFAGLASGVVRANRVGTAYHDLFRFFSETNTELTAAYDRDTVPDDRVSIVKRSRLWMLRNDLAGYILLGDPAVRLPLASTTNVSAGKINTPSVNDRARRVIAMGAPPTVAVQPRDEMAMERAVIAVLAGEDARAVASRSGVNPDELVRWTNEYQQAGRMALRRLR